MSCGPAFFEAVCQVPGNDTLDYNLAVTDLRQTCDGYDAMDGSRHILVVDDDKELRGLLALPDRQRISRFRCAGIRCCDDADDERGAHRSDHPRHHDAGRGRSQHLPPAARQRDRSDHHAHGERLGVRSSARPRNGRRRLPFQAIWHPRAARPRSCRPAARGDARTRDRQRAPVGSSSLRAGAWTCRDGSCVRRRTRWSISVPRSSTCSSHSSNIRSGC